MDVSEIEGGRQREQDTLEQLYRQYYRAAYLYVLSLCRNVELAEDLVADAFVKAYLAYPGEHTGFRFWLLRVCRNLWLDHLRKTRRRADMPAEQFTDQTPERICFEKERNAALYRCIEGLPPGDREILTLFYFSGLSIREIAALLVCTEGTIKTRLFRARGKLRQKMEEEGYGIS